MTEPARKRRWYPRTWPQLLNVLTALGLLALAAVMVVDWLAKH